MAKSLKRAGIVFFAFVLSLLLVLGTMSATNAVENNSIVNTSTSNNLVLDENNLQDSSSNLNLSKDADYFLKGDCDDIAELWNAAVLDSLKNKRVIKVIMESDWIAKDVDEVYKTSFGEGFVEYTSFGEGRIYVPGGTNLILDLNGHKIDRNLFNSDGAHGAFCITVNGKLSVLDSAYDSDEVYKLLANGQLNQENVDKLNFGKITGGNNSQDGFYAGGIRAEYGGVINFYSGMICNNKATYAAGLSAMRNGYINFYDGLIFGNISGNNGGGVCSGIESSVVLRGGIVANNSSHNGAGVYSYTVSTVDIRNTIITNNTGLADNPMGGGAFISADCTIKIGTGTQIYGNFCDGKENNLYLSGDNLAQVSSGYFRTSNINALHITNVGVTLDNPRIFTKDFDRYNNGTSPATFFFSDNKSYSITQKTAQNINDEVELLNVASTTKTLTWKYNEEQTTNRIAVVPYTGNPYTISAIGCNILHFAQGVKPSYEATDVGFHAFCASDIYSNVVFTLIIVPKEVDLEWITNLTYNGVEQKPTAQIKSGQLVDTDECEVNVFGGATNVGNNYYAEARSLSNPNYKIKNTSKSVNYNILPASLTIDITTKNAEKNYTGNSVDLGNDWYNMSATLLGQDNKKSLSSVFNIDYSKFIPMFTMDGVTTSSAINVGKYDISLKNFDANSVFTGNNNYNVVVNYVNGGTLTISMAEVIRASAESGYSYLLLDDNNKRTAYESKALLHGENDGNVNIKDGKATYVLGNINPNTDVKTFINNLVFDTTKVNLYNSQDKLIYTNGTANIAEGITEDMLNSRFELAVGTGWYIEYNVNGEKEIIYLSVLGDINGDGRISASDVTYLRELANNATMYDNLDVEFKLAGLVINKGSITSADSEVVINVINKMLEIDWFY